MIKKGLGAAIAFAAQPVTYGEAVALMAHTRLDATARRKCKSSKRLVGDTAGTGGKSQTAPDGKRRPLPEQPSDFREHRLWNGIAVPFSVVKPDNSHQHKGHKRALLSN